MSEHVSDEEVDTDGVADLEEPILEGDEPRTTQDYVRDSQVGVVLDDGFAVDPDTAATEGGWTSGS